MATKKTKDPVPFSVMSGEGDSLIVGEKAYTVKPMLVGDALKFLEEGLSIGSQIFNLADPKAKAKLEGYISSYCTNEAGEAMDISKISEAGWSIVDLKNFMKKLCDISG